MNSTDLKQDKNAYERVLIRNYSEVNLAQTQLIAYRKLFEVQRVISTNSFLGVAAIALKNDMFSHLIKVLERGNKCYGFFKLYKAFSGKIDPVLKRNNTRLNHLKKMGDKLSKIRNKTHFHLDIDGVINSKAIWEEANITGDDVDNTITTLVDVFSTLYREDFSKNPLFPSYNGDDIFELLHKE